MTLALPPAGNHPSPLPDMTLALPPNTNNPETDWEREVWKWVNPEFNELITKATLSKAEGAGAGRHAA